MIDQDLGMFIIVFFGGLILGVILTLLINKVKSGSASPGAIKKEMEDYQDKVEAHFDESSKKFKQMADQYSDLYKHLSIGATTLCRPENISPGLMADQNPLMENLEENSTIDAEASPEPELDQQQDQSAEASNDVETDIDAETDAKIQAELEKLKAQSAQEKV